MDPLIFIDTNILLDFYRIRRSDIGLSLLKHVDNQQAKIITGSQVEMEFKRNRQKVIAGELADFKKGSLGNSSLPAILSDTQYGKTYKKKLKDVEAYEKKIKQKIEKILHDPTHNDPVYRCFQRLFKSRTPFNLNRTNNQRNSIRRLARKRFGLGYPACLERHLFQRRQHQRLQVKIRSEDIFLHTYYKIPPPQRLELPPYWEKSMMQKKASYNLAWHG